MSEAYILEYARSPIARADKGAFAHTRIDDIAAQVIAGLLSRVPALEKSGIEDVIIGCAMPEGEQGLNVARNVALLAGLPVSVPAATINRFCASSLAAIGQAAQAIRSGDGGIFLAGGLESMSHVPMGGFNPSFNERLMREGGPDAYIGMGMTAENLAREYSISRKEQDGFALESHRKAVSALGQGRFDEELVFVEAKLENSSKTLVMRDECPRPNTSIEALADLPPAFLDDGTVTAGNSSPRADGAAMLLVGTKEMANRLGVKPRARIVSMAAAGVDPATMGRGPVFAVPKAISRAGMRLDDIDLIELNEAFAAQSIAVMRELDLDGGRVNVHGGAIALGHPLGMSGARIVITLLGAMETRGASTGLATMCVGGGQGVAAVVERV